MTARPIHATEKINRFKTADDDDDRIKLGFGVRDLKHLLINSSA